jgi:hypothetical protein
MRLPTVILGLALCASAVAACSDTPTRSNIDGSSTTAISPQNPEANGMIRGTVLGPTGADTTNFQPVADVVVEAYSTSSVEGDSVPPVRVADVVTDESGRFEFTRVPAGGYTLSALPAANTPFLPSGAYAIASSGSGLEEVTIHLGRRP